MKKLLLTGTLLVAAAAAFGQGQIVFANGTATKITNNVTSLAAAGLTTFVGLYVGTDTNASFASPFTTMTLPSNGVTNLFAAGLYQGGNRALNGVAIGTPIAVQIRAWSGSSTYTSYEDAMTHAGTDANLLVGASTLMIITPTGAPAGGATLAGLNQFNIAPVPEPSSIALGLLGLGAVALFRRKK